MKNKRVVIAWTLLIGWMILIFFMSSQPGDISSKQSDLVIKLFALLGIDLNSAFGELATLVVRKTAHVSEYCILYLLSINLLKNYLTIKNSRIYSLIIVFSYACSDEIHQYFVPGRSMAFTDIMIDFFGGIVGFVINSIWEKVKIKK